MNFTGIIFTSIIFYSILPFCGPEMNSFHKKYFIRCSYEFLVFYSYLWFDAQSIVFETECIEMNILFAHVKNNNKKFFTVEMCWKYLASLLVP